MVEISANWIASHDGAEASIFPGQIILGYGLSEGKHTLVVRTTDKAEGAIDPGKWDEQTFSHRSKCPRLQEIEEIFQKGVAILDRLV